MNKRTPYITIFLSMLLPSSSFAIDLEEITPSQVGRDFLEMDQLTIESEKDFIRPMYQRKKTKKEEFVLKGVEFSGNTVLSNNELKCFYSDYVNKNVSMHDLRMITNSVTKEYQDRGYVLSRAVLNPQRIHGGVVKVGIIEGKVNSVNFSGADVKEYAWTEEQINEIKQQKVSTSEVLERNLNLINDLPGVMFEEVNYKTLANGNVDINVKLTQKDFDLYGSVTNIQNRIYGNEFLMMGVDVNETKVAGKTTLLTGQSIKRSRLRFYHIEHEQQVSSNGLKFGLINQWMHMKPVFTKSDTQYNAQNIRARGVRTSLESYYPLIRSQEVNWFLQARLQRERYFADRNVDPTVLFNDLLTNLSVGTIFEHPDQLLGSQMAANNILEFEVTKGLKVFGANDSTLRRSKTGGKVDYFKANASADRLQMLTNQFYLRGSVSGQYSFNSLLSPASYVYGGDRYGRGYDSPVIEGDQGVSLGFELGREFMKPHEKVDSVKTYVFYDIGKSWNKVLDNEALDLVANADLKKNYSASSAGIGLYTSAFQDKVFARLEYGKPLSRKNNEGNKKGRVFFRLTGIL